MKSRKCFLCQRTEGVDCVEHQYPREVWTKGEPICAYCDDWISRRAVRETFRVESRGRRPGETRFNEMLKSVNEVDHLFVLGEMADVLRVEANRIAKAARV